MKTYTASKNLSERIVSFRTRKNLSVLDMSRLTGVSRRTLGRIESEFGYNPTLDTLVKLSTSLHMPINRLIGQPARLRK